MALPATEIGNFRTRVNGLSDALRAIDSALAIIEDFGADDAARQAFFESSLGANTDHPDLTWAAFAAGVVGMRNMRTAWNTNKLAIVKLRR
jgi:hypothetical protein